MTEINETLVSMLRDLLQRAESGELQSLVGTGFAASDDRIAIWADFHPDVYQMAGSLAWLQSEYMLRHADDKSAALSGEQVYGCSHG